MSEIEDLVAHFERERQRICASNSTFTETEARVEFIDPLFEMLGWDMRNQRGLPNSLKDVVREESQVNESSWKRPDYTFRIGSARKFFLEAKKPAVDIRTHRDSAFQTRSYGWTAGMAISILTNFRTIRIYDTTTEPNSVDDVNVGLLMEVDFQDIPAKFHELLGIFGREAVASGSIESRFGVAGEGQIPINVVFLEKFNGWRLRIAGDLHRRYPALSIDELSDIAQKVINRLIIIRMCEDRGIEGRERLRNIALRKDIVELRRLFQQLDDRYNTGLFDCGNDPLQTVYAIDAQVFLDIVEELYFPQAPYSFSVLDADFLGQVYELFLVKRLVIHDGTDVVTLQDKPQYEGREVVTTPQVIVDELVRRTVSGRLNALREQGTLNWESLTQLRVLDIAVGSGRFLLRCLDELVDAAIEHFQHTGDASKISRRAENDYRLVFEAKRQLLESCLFGIDIDYNAVEVARFSLVVKLLEDEQQDTLPTGRKILPNLDSNVVWGNTVLETGELPSTPQLIQTSRPLDWSRSGIPLEFDLVVGNPPYMKTEEMKTKHREEFDFYKARYKTPFKQFDKYFVFLEKGIERLKESGCVGMVVSNKWLNIEAGAKLRELLAERRLVSEIVDFGNELVFAGKSTYVCLLVLNKQPRESFRYRHVHSFGEWMVEPSAKGITLGLDALERYGKRPWVLPADDDEAKVLGTLWHDGLVLSDVADVINGFQTSAEDVFAIKNWSLHGTRVRFEKAGRIWEVEEQITRPYLMDSGGVSSFASVVGDGRVIFPYELGGRGEAVLIPPARMASDFPLAWEYLNAHSVRLSRRDVSPPPAPGEFYRFGRHQALNTAFADGKIIYSVNQLGDKYGWDSAGVGFASGGTAGEVAITNPRMGYSLEFLLALLNHRTSEFFLRKRGSPFRGGYYSRGSAVVSDLPVPRLDFENAATVSLHNEVVRLTRELISLRDRSGSAVGRAREEAGREEARLRRELKQQFDQLWNFDGADGRISLPGE
ncbi:Eco57I restriction-modification methylase domain-containing protein [Prosthecobacter dejongeii]|uniref:site-specific DNA-methyltransferase (adenine-specific) n=1 Tax=Prosthecobacter dejongeii TaxID=48465 RepID=A0A7W7YR48_9BACT|nr:N-6 DNA methylase [Prosthecobacter dejongeii]MBB5040575.1 hypothetical protein [Prosthecobacter dejongeii]